MLAVLAFIVSSGVPQYPPRLDLPDRKQDAPTGSILAGQIAALPHRQREDRIFAEIDAGNVPSFIRKLAPVAVAAKVNGQEISGTVYVTPDYLAVGSDDDYLFVPMTPYTAQRVADRVHCVLPTPKIVDAVYSAATVKLAPSPIPPSPAMTTVQVFLDHTRTVRGQRAADPAPMGALTAGDKKDVVICKGLPEAPAKVAIYGWHRRDGKPIQPLYLGHTATWADYSHGIRLVWGDMIVDGVSKKVVDVLKDPVASALLSDEGPIVQSSYSLHQFPVDRPSPLTAATGERFDTFAPIPGVRVVIDRPEVLLPKVRLVIYALPNGNTIEQTIGRKTTADEDWHYDIQHIGAQTRFLRARMTGESLVVAYLEASNHSWPAWLHGAKTDPTATTTIYGAILDKFKGSNIHVVLDSHSGGGAFIFDFLKTVDRVPYQIDRIAFLDSEYNYDPALHLKKLADWLKAGGHYLCAIAYDDASALYNGKPFVTATGGTWGRTHAMLADLGKEFDVRRVNSFDPERYVGLEGRITMLLKENPTHEIFHTVQVERNGFIESILSGEPSEEDGYKYFGPRAYTKYIRG
ncbi:MAG: hypothetical protein P4L46_04580 [Fimbriimonas sp.]|nr:hypothetical protein [Fimbriimonas sp.]